MYVEASTSTRRRRHRRNERRPYHSYTSGATVAAAATFGITVLRAAKCERDKADSGQDKQVSRPLEEVNDSAIPTAEVGTRCDGRTPLQNEESTGHPMLVVRQQTTERESPHAQMSQMEKRA